MRRAKRRKTRKRRSTGLPFYCFMWTDMFGIKSCDYQGYAKQFWTR